MGKYIVDIDKKNICSDDNGSQLAITVKVNDASAIFCTEIPLTPYTEPNMEKVREGAFKNGYDAACKDIDIKSKTNAAHRKGLEDAWYAARKLWEYDTTTLKKIFGKGVTRMDFFMKFNASEAIAKIKEYEDSKQEIKVGDEVITASGKAVVMGVGPVHFEYVYADGSHGYDEVKNVKKTGRHFPEIAEVLQKMKETNNG